MCNTRDSGARDYVGFSKYYLICLSSQNDLGLHSKCIIKVPQQLWLANNVTPNSLEDPPTASRIRNWVKNHRETNDTTHHLNARSKCNL